MNTSLLDLTAATAGKLTVIAGQSSFVMTSDFVERFLGICYQCVVGQIVALRLGQFAKC
ncbi:MAG: hypothetical protein NTW52_02930 [Planctomycetota bacterium]|nr:hypothetical protein [Planctomycetota bacterium]